MINFNSKKKIQKTFHTIQILAVLLSFLLSLQPVEATQARPANSIGTINLTLSTKDISRVEFGYHYSSFESTDTEYKLDVKAGQLTDGKVKAPLSILNSLVSGLHGMYPGTRPLSWQSWSDDYPHAWINLYLNDGKHIEISSDSQFNGMFPWNVSLWGSENAAQPDAMYIQLHPTFLNGVDALWRGVSQQGFPRGLYSASFWNEMLGDPAPATVQYSIGGSGDADSAPVWGASSALLAPFLPALIRNSEIKTLLDAGYSLYDAAFTLEVNTSTLEPVQYSGMLALAAPSGGDAVVGLVTLPFATGKAVKTTLKAADSMQLVEQRKASQFLNGVSQILTPLTYILDTRAVIEAPKLDCPKNNNISLSQAFQAIWNPAQPKRITFYHLADGRWSVDLGLQHGDPNWDDRLVQTILKDWFPKTIAALPIQDLQSVDTSWQIAFQPDVTLRNPKLLDGLKSGLPDELIVHAQDSEKAGDYSFLKLDGRVVISENGDSPIVVYCGITPPDYYGPAYSIGSVVPPNDQASRNDMPGGIHAAGGIWYALHGSLPWGQYSAQWVSMALSQPGFMHVLWSVQYDGVYYADGWIDGSGWTAPQRLGDASDWVYVLAWPDGEVHLFWDAGLTSGGMIHVWKSAGGAWQKPEYWAKVDYFGDILRDSNGVLHIGGTFNDGLDTEFVYRTWSPEKGISAPENISRHRGDIGNGYYFLRFDSKGQLHAAWSHILEQKSAPDPITGETSDLSGVFYARRLPDGHWSQPEQVGTLAPYADAMSVEMDVQDNPLIIWQADSGLVSRIKKNGEWEDAIELASVKPPDTPAEFGPGRWVQPTATLRTAVNTQGQIIAGWLIPSICLKMSSWSGTGWADAIDIVPAEDISKLSSETPALEMVVDNQDHIHFVFFEYEDYTQGSQLYYAEYDRQKAELHPLSIYYDMYGYPIARLEVDSVGSVAMLAMPVEPAFEVKLPLAGIPPTPSPTPKPSPTPRLTMIHLPTLTPPGSSTPQQLAKKSGIESPVPMIIGFGTLLAIIFIGIVAVRLMKKRPPSE